MASEFIGYTILVTLQKPPGAQLQGVVADVVNQRLYLQNVVLLWNGQNLPTYTLDATAISDLEVSPSPTLEARFNEVPSNTFDHSNTAIPTSLNKPAITSSFVDPAILSYSKPRRNQHDSNTIPTSIQIQPVSPIMIADGAVVGPPILRSSHTITGQSSISSISTSVPKPSRRRDSSATAILTEPFDAMALKDDVADITKEKKGRKLGRKGKEIQTQVTSSLMDSKEGNSGGLKQVKKLVKGKGWRQTPLTEELPKQNGSKKQRGRKSFVETTNGWATEDATDIQDMGDFDFESNLSKFDKRRVFDDIRKDDPTAEDERLVTFNRKAKAGTNGGRNLHFTENVLDPPNLKVNWKSEAGETEDDQREETHSSSRGSRRASSRRPLQSRKGSTLNGQFDQTESPRPLTRLITASPINGSTSGPTASFKLQNNKPCHCVSPLQMLEIEELCISEMSLTEDMLAENAGRSIAEAVLKFSLVRNVLFLVGNHKSGARAVAAARHLRNRRLRVTVIVLGGEREDTLLEVMRKQIMIYKKGQGYVDRWDEYNVKLEGGSAPPDLVVDALFGVHVTFDELRIDDQAAAFEMIKWCGRNSTIVVLSIDVPSGLSASSGLISETEGQMLIMNAKQVIALGAPKTGLLYAMAMDGPEASWQVLVADIGISLPAWQKHGSRRKHGLEFGNEWILPINFVTRMG